MRVVRRTARAILIDEESQLVLFRRTLPRRKPYWSTPGGGVDPEDDSIEAALHRELAEELGATVDRVQQVFLASPPRGDGIAVAHFFVCRLVSMDLSLRTGEEFSNPAKGRYDVERIDLRGKKLSRYALQPPEVREFILANRHALLETVLDASAPPLTSAHARAACETPQPPVTEAPAATAEEPTAEEPTADAPTTDAPTTEEPTTEEPAVEASDVEAPDAGEAPDAEVATTAASSGSVPSADSPPAKSPGPAPVPDSVVRVPWVPAPAPAVHGSAVAQPAAEPARSRRRGRPAVLEIVDDDGTGPAPEPEPRESARRAGWWRRLAGR
ncbi:NUDIX domain-containing protein [Frankia sp. AgKG'84/4]|uniref:NUDIX domain-containing protein n=1 Tax=Frankia sp. AgKG'84/4 TaxID=573490 RepID=UPI00201095B0|nr:NUDIX hydrolase [Frankia sp. AgKG'84/4]MCL9793134.1 NUDIX domain-containing protein [Frankia sp. AgKG'84/4]